MATSELRIKEFLIKSSFTYKYQFDIIHESVLQPHIYQKYNPRRQNETTIQACPISGSSDYGEWLLMCDLYSWSFHCFSCTCWDKERARSSAQPRVLRNDRKSNWLHATLSRERPGQGPLQKSRYSGWQKQAVPHHLPEAHLCLPHHLFTRVEIKTFRCISMHLRGFWNRSPTIMSHGCFLKSAVDSQTF